MREKYHESHDRMTWTDQHPLPPMGSFAKSLLDVADYLGRASSVVQDRFTKFDMTEDPVGALPLLKTLLEGVEMTKKQVLSMSRLGGAGAVAQLRIHYGFYSIRELRITCATDWRYDAKQFVKRLPKKVIIHCSGCNYSTLTFDGVDRMWERLAEEVEGAIKCYLLVARSLQVDFATQLLNMDVSASHYQTPIRFYPGVPDAC
ncbi:hypothetical protein SSX86_005508 [Deinandra increscens subsp. villosa]|uniref:DUF676 domain-containing protein n=1 Tax=Deinandra increscens subsp. villosa TaxID=3103831 RepID=A0AAP0HA47_9ASTR